MSLIAINYTTGFCMSLVVHNHTIMFSYSPQLHNRLVCVSYNYTTCYCVFPVIHKMRPFSPVTKMHKRQYVALTPNIK